MRSLLLFIAVLCAFSVKPCQSQDLASELSASEIVERHEATWAKLQRVRFDLESENQHARMATSVRLDPFGKRVTETDLYEVKIHVQGAICLDGERSSARIQVLDHRVVNDESSTALPHGEKPETREIHDDGMIISIGPKQVVIDKPSMRYPKTSSFTLGKNISIAMMAVQVSLRDWVAEAKPAVERTTNAAGETCYVLTGDFKTNTTPTQEPTFRTDKVAVTLNADRGCLIERIQFACEKQEQFLCTKSTNWRVVTWHNVENGLSFPAQLVWETECWDHPHKDWLNATVSNMKPNPADLAAQFEYSIPAGALVYDRTGRPGTSPVSIWGSDGKPAKTYASEEVYHREMRAIEMEKLARRQEEDVAKMFPGCTVKVTRLEEKDDFHTIVYREDGSILHEFKSNEELAIAESVQGLIRSALGADREQTRRR